MRQGILFIILLLLLPIAVAVQDLLPAIPPFQGRVQLLPVVFCFGVMALPLVPSLYFALATALVQGLVLLQIQSGQVELGLTVPVVFFLTWAILLQMASEATFTLASRIAKMAPVGLDKIFFTNSGSEAVDTALKIAIGYHRVMGNASRTRMVGRDRAYHGDGIGGFSALAVAGHSVQYGTAAPVTGTWAQGDIVYNTACAPGGNVGWICTTGGTSGTWKTFGQISL